MKRKRMIKAEIQQNTPCIEKSIALKIALGFFKFILDKIKTSLAYDFSKRRKQKEFSILTPFISKPTYETNSNHPRYGICFCLLQ